MSDESARPDRTDIPPAPWQLSGSACMSLWRIDEQLLPYPGADIGYATLGGKAVLVGFWANYSGEGTLQYQELAIAVMVRSKGVLGPSCTVNHIWVDDPAARDGGRELWSIPKELGVFTPESSPADRSFAARLSVERNDIASLQFEANLGIPGHPRISGFIVQPASRGPQRTRCAARGRVVLGKAKWDFAEAGPLGFLRGVRPAFSCRVLGLQGWFGI